MGCLIFFSLPFAAVGAGMAIWQIYSVGSFVRMQNWVEVPARILKVELIENSDGDGITYETKAEYEYEYRGAKHKGARVGIDRGADNIGGFQQTAYEELKHYEQSKRPFRCYVNPGNAAESILYRNFRWPIVFFKIIFVVLFGGVGFGLLLLGFASSADAPSAAKASSETPWLSRVDWASGRIVHSGKPRAMAAVFATAVWNIAAAPAWFALAGLLPWPEGASFAVALGLMAVGALLAVWAVSRPAELAPLWRVGLSDDRRTRRDRRKARWCRRNGLPGRTGGHLPSCLEMHPPRNNRRQQRR